MDDRDWIAHVRPAAWANPTARHRYNLVVIGAGPGGLVASAAAAALGARVALVEANRLGGDCLNYGCVPSKALLSAARIAANARRACDFGVSTGQVAVDFAAVMQRMQALRAQIARNDSAQRFRDLGVDVYFGRAEFTGPHALHVEGQTLTFSKAIIATGSRPHVPDIPGLSETPHLTTDTIFNLTELPRRLVVLGAGPAGMELAQAFQRFGSQVTVLARETVLRQTDPDAARVVVASLEQDGVTFVRGVEATRVRPHSIGLSDGRVVEFDALLVAAGRRPAVHDLHLQAAGITFDSESGVHVNDFLQTTNPDVFAIGDVASRRRFTHLSDSMARIAVRNALFFGRRRLSALQVPSVIFTEPEIAHIGSSKGRAITREARNLDRTVLEGCVQGFVRIHVDDDSDRIRGATIVLPHAGEMIGEIAVAMRARMGLASLAEIMHAYPTMSDAIRQCADAYNRTRLTPRVKSLFGRLMSWRR